MILLVVPPAGHPVINDLHELALLHPRRGSRIAGGGVCFLIFIIEQYGAMRRKLVLHIGWIRRDHQILWGCASLSDQYG